MGNDIEEVILRLTKQHPKVRIVQLNQRHAADDNGLWFVSLGGVQVQLESSSGNCPFLLESNANDNRRNLQSIDEVIAALEDELMIHEGKGK
jgi:hypothetical protein